VDKATSDRLLEYIITEDLGLYQRADLILSLLSPQNVGDILRSLPSEMRTEFLEFARATYLTTGPRVEIRGPLDRSTLDALGVWVAAGSELETGPVPKERPSASQLDRIWESSFAAA
jgi:hypothetical protein